MADIAHCVPAIVTVREGSSFGFTRPGLQQTAFISGRYLSRDWHGYDVREYDLDFTRLVNSTTALEEWSAFWHHIDGGHGEGYLVEPISETHRELICGGLADGTKTTFPIPVITPTSVTVFVDGVPQESSAYTLHTKANLLTDDKYASPSSADDFSAVAATDAAATGVSLDGLSCLKVTPAGSGSDIRTYPSHNAGGAVTIGESYTAVIAVLETASTPRDFKSLVRWIDTDRVFVSNSEAASATTAATGSWVVLSNTATAPATTVYAIAGVWETNDDADPFYVDCLAINPGDYNRWHLPSQSPGLVEFASAPASGARITATATGQRLARCRFDPGSRWSMTSPGDAVLRSVRAIEVVEF